VTSFEEFEFRTLDRFDFEFFLRHFDESFSAECSHVVS
jgi:hypothetical protein